MDPATPAPTDERPERPHRRRRRSTVLRTFGTKLLTTFAALLFVATTLVFTAAGVYMKGTNERVLEQQVTLHLESVAGLTALELEQRANLRLLKRAASESPIARELARKALVEICTSLRDGAQVRDVVIFTVDWPAADEEALDVEILATGGQEEAVLLGRLLADANLYILKSRQDRRPASSSIWSDGLPEETLYKTAYMPVIDADAQVCAYVGIELPAKFEEAVDEIYNTFMVLGALAGLTVLLTAVFLVRQRVHVPVYRLVRAMQRPDGPEPARIRHNDEIGVLTQHYNEMVERLQDKDQKLREAYEQAREVASYLKGYSNSLVAGVPSGVVAVDTQGKVAVWNARAQQILRTTAAIGEPLPSSDGTLARALKSALGGSFTDQAHIVLEFPVAGEDEPEQRLVELTCAPFRDEEGELLGAVAVLGDRTELEHLRRMASRNERLTAIGSLGGGLAHEIKNPLSAISGFAELIARKSEGDTARLVERLLGEIRELNSFLNKFLSFARDDSIRREPTALPALLRRSVEASLESLGFEPDVVHGALEGEPFELPGGGKLTVKINLADDLPRLALDPLLMRSVFVNLVRNAVQAMSGDGELVVRAHRVGQAVYVRFRDQGPGIPLENRERVFDPLFTTRAEGTGLGLAICHKTVTAHGGKLSVRDAPGGGAELVVRIPLVLAPSSRESHPLPKNNAERLSRGQDPDRG